MKKISRAWRLIGTAISFGLFGLGGLILSVTAFPLIWLLVREARKRTRIARRTVTGAFCLFIETMRILGVLRYTVIDKEIAEQAGGCLVIANHPSLIDVVFLLSLFREAECVVKRDMWSNPFTALAMRAVDYIPNDDPETVMTDCVERLKRGQNLILFPESTRTRPNQLPQFSRAAATIAVRARTPCLPVVIGCTPTTLTKNEPWYHIPEERVLFEMRLLEPVSVAPFLEHEENERRASKSLNIFLRDLMLQHMEIPRQNG